MLRSRKKLGIFNALPCYIGGKRRLVGRIFGEINAIVPRRLWPRLVFLDAFMGGGSVALYAKCQGFGKVIGTDLALRSVTVGQALIANTRTKLTKADVIRVLAPYDGPPGRVEREMVPAVFTQTVGRAIDSALRVADQTPDENKGALIRLLAIRVAMLAHPYGQVRAGTAHRLTTQEYENITPSATYHYLDALRLASLEKMWSLAQAINGGIVEGKGEVYQTDVLEVLPTIPADICYADPPYANVCSYEKEYRVLDQILEGLTRPTSPFTSRDGANQIDLLLERAAHVPVVVLSFGNAACTLEDLEGKMIKAGRKTKAIAIKYLHLPAVATQQKKEANREFLLVGVDPDAALIKGAAA
ncbi:MAG: DNA adenine methylase [Candidatus Polarisedimenticolia bacterium]